jgi:hypothetical protein
MKYFTLTLALMLVVATTPAFAYQSGTGDPGTGDPGTGDPGTGDPGTGDPGTGDPGTGDPGTGDPGTGDPGTGDPGTGDPGTGDPWTGNPPNSPPQIPWEFTSPDDGMSSYGEVVFTGTGPNDSVGALSVYSYSNSTEGGVLGSEVQLQMTVLVDTDPGIDWVGPVYGTPGEGYATIMPAVGAPNVGLLTLIEGGGYSGTGVDLGTLALLGGGDSVLFNIIMEP